MKKKNTLRTLKKIKYVCKITHEKEVLHKARQKKMEKSKNHTTQRSAHYEKKGTNWTTKKWDEEVEDLWGTPATSTNK